jgi:hypothetical protein
MFLTPVYKAIKNRLTPAFADGTAIPVFFYISQYLPGKENTSYRVPAIYIDMPDDSKIEFLPRKIMHSKDALIKIHLVTYAPFKNHDDAVQDAAVLLHDSYLKQIDVLINGWFAIEGGVNLTQQFLTKGGSFLQFKHMCLVSVLTYQTEIYSRHLQG